MSLVVTFRRVNYPITGTVDSSVGGRLKLTTNTSYYVSSSGSDSNPGTKLSPWLTLQKAVNYISSSIDIAGMAVTVNITAGSFVGVGLKACVGGGIVFFNGAGLGQTIITPGPNDGTFNQGGCVDCFIPFTGVGWFFNNVTFDSSSLTSRNQFNCITMFGAGNTIVLQDMTQPSNFTGTTELIGNVNDFAVLVPAPGCEFADTSGTNGVVKIKAPSGGTMLGFCKAYFGGSASFGSTLTTESTPAWGTAFMQTLALGNIQFFGAISGGATGKRYDAEGNGVINTFGGGANAFPGNSAGTTSNGGQYL